MVKGRSASKPRKNRSGEPTPRAAGLRGSLRRLIGLGAIVLLAIAAWTAGKHWLKEDETESPGPRPVADSEHDEHSLRRQALVLADRLLREFPASPDALFLRGLILAKWAYGTEAARCWEECLKLVPGHAAAYVQLGQSAYRAGDYERAAAMFRRAVEIDAKVPAASLGLGEALLDGGRTDEAVLVLAKHIAQWPDSAPGQLRLGEAYLRQRSYQEAKTCFERLTKLEPGFARGYFGLMTACARLGEHQQAQECQAKFGQLRTTDRTVALARKREQGDEPTLRRMLAETYVSAGSLYLAHGLVQEAEDCWKKAAARDPTDAESRRLLAKALIERGDYRSALQPVEELQRLQPKVADYWLSGGRLHASLQQFEAAERSFQKAIELAPKRAEAQATLAQLYVHAARNLAEAKRLAQGAVQLEPTAQYYALLSDACAGNGDRAGALTAIERAVELDPGSAVYREALSRVRQRP